MMENPTEKLEAFDANGIHVGSAAFMHIGKRWYVAFYVKTQEEAEELLRAHGAVHITEKDGLERRNAASSGDTR